MCYLVASLARMSAINFFRDAWISGTEQSKQVFCLVLERLRNTLEAGPILSPCLLPHTLNCTMGRYLISPWPCFMVLILGTFIVRLHEESACHSQLPLAKNFHRMPFRAIIMSGHCNPNLLVPSKWNTLGGCIYFMYCVDLFAHSLSGQGLLKWFA